MNLQFEFLFIYVATYFFIALFCAVLLSRVNTDIGRQLEVRYFRFLLIALLLYCIFESIWAIGNFGYSQAINRFNIPLSVINHIMVMAFCFFWFCYMESYLQSPLLNKRNWALYAGIPFFLVVALTISTLLNGQVFYISEDGTAARGPLYIITVVLSYVYAAIATIRAIIAAIQTSDRQRKAELVTMSLFVIPPAAVGVIDTLVPTMPIVAPAFFFSFLIVFTMLQESQISTDSLTRLNNRRRADRHFDEMRRLASEKDPYVLFIVDCNGFKRINDTYGHLEGDQALCIVANALRDACRNSTAFIGRWGGDEFVVMARENEITSPEAFIDLVDDCLLYESYQRELPYKLTVSIGWTYCTGQKDSRRKLLEAADASLYSEKSKK